MHALQAGSRRATQNSTSEPPVVGNWQTSKFAAGGEGVKD